MEQPTSRPTALVTGAANGLGRVLAERLAEQGYALALLDLDGGALERTASALRREGAHVIDVQVDVSDRFALDAALSRVADEFGYVDLCAPFAGIFSSNEVEDESVRQLVLDVNLGHAVRCAEWAQDAAAAAGRSTHAVLSGSSSGVTRNPTDAYSLSKQELLLSATQLRRRGRRLARRSKAECLVTLAIIHLTATDFGTNTERVYEHHRLLDTERTKSLDELDEFLHGRGRDPKVVVDEILAAVRSGRTSAQLTGSERSGFRGRLEVDLLLPWLVRLRRLRSRGPSLGFRAGYI